MKKHIIDTHVHIWDLKKARYEWLDGDTSLLNRSYHLEELLPEAAETAVASGILVQAANHIRDTDQMLEIARQYPFITGVVGWLPLTDPVQTAGLLASRFLQEAYFKGVRHLIHNETDPAWLLRAPVLESLQVLAANNIPFDVVGVNETHLQTAIRVSEKIPGLRLVLDHLNQPPVKDGQRLGNWGVLMKEIAGNSNVFAKISGLGTASGNPDNWKAEDLQPCIAHTLQAFGPGRCMLGGDWPVSLLSGSYARHWEAYTRILDNLLGPDDAAKVYSGTATRFYNVQ